MPQLHAWRWLAAASLLLAAAPASASNCYMVVDRADHVVYQNLVSPVDLSDKGAAARQAMRARGDQLIAMDTESCPSIDTRHLASGDKPATVEEIVAGMRPALLYGGRGRLAPDSASRNIGLPAISVPRDTDGPISTSGLPSGVSLR
ncbi:MAG TPA: hypothetical protein VLU54_06125 [Casimicrobiaceae bacterium]|nr:hypothetical protein [Casimicrobiaceae bacterium]